MLLATRVTLFFVVLAISNVGILLEFITCTSEEAEYFLLSKSKIIILSLDPRPTE